MEPHFDARVARLATAHHGIVTLRHVYALGATRDAAKQRIAAGRWHAVHEGVYRIAGAPVTWRSLVLAACWAGGTRAVASHTSAATLWDLPSGRTDVVEVTCPRWKRARHDDVTVHETTMHVDGHDRATVDNIPCTSPERTLFDLARTTRPVMLDANIDAALRRGLVTLDSLISTVDRLATKGRPGGKRFRAAVTDRLGGGGTMAESVPERFLAAALVRHGLPRPRLQYEVRTPAGEFVARVDLAYPEWRILIEYDSFEHHVGKLALVRDGARRNALQELGYTVLTATAVDIRDGARALAGSVRRIRERVT
jgi:very-short-patch-repair endonuclease